MVLGNFGKDSRLHHEKLGLGMEDLDGASRFGIYPYESEFFQEERARYMAGRTSKKGLDDDQWSKQCAR